MIQKKVSITLDSNGIKAMRILKAFSNMYGLSRSEAFSIIVKKGMEGLIVQGDGDIKEDFIRFIEYNSGTIPYNKDRVGLEKYPQVDGDKLFEVRRNDLMSTEFWMSIN